MVTGLTEVGVMDAESGEALLGISYGVDDRAARFALLPLTVLLADTQTVGDGRDDATAAIVEKLGFIRDYICDLQSISRLAKPVPPPKPETAAPSGSPSAHPAENANTTATPSKAHGQSIAPGTNESGVMRPSVRESRAGHGVSASRHSVSTGSEA